MVAAAGSHSNTYQVMNLDDNSTGWYSIKVAANTAGNCTDTDNGARPLVGTITAHTVNPVSHRMLTDLPLLEFACGNDIIILGLPNFNSNWAYAMIPTNPPAQ